MNKAILIGNLAKDVELRNTQGGKTVGSVSLATNKSYTDASGNKVKTATFHNLVLWNKAAEIFAQYTKKGDKVYVEGEINNRSYEAKDGSKRYISEIVVSEFEFLNSANRLGDAPAPRVAARPAAARRTSEQVEQTADSDDEIIVEKIPF